jgi:hypothetical protein
MNFLLIYRTSPRSAKDKPLSGCGSGKENENFRERFRKISDLVGGGCIPDDSCDASSIVFFHC